MDEIPKRAEILIGADDPASDWKLAPEAHAAKLPPEAGALRRVLEQPAVREIMAQFEAADAAAVAAQAKYKRVARLRLYAGLSATIIGATFVLPLETWMSSTWRSIPAAVQYGCLCASLLAALYLSRIRPFDAWMKARARAEIARISLFNLIINSPDEQPRPDETAPLPLKLEYFRRYQLDVQRRYYSGRGAQHMRAAGQTRRWQAMSIGLTGLAGAIALIAALKIVIDLGISVPAWIESVNSAALHYLPSWTNKATLAIGIVASALFSASVARSLMDLDERNASRYLTTAANLDHVRAAGLAQAREQAAAGNVDAVREFVGQIQRMVSAEHQEWILLGETAPATFKRFEYVR